MTARPTTEPFASTRIRILSPQAHEIELVLERAGYGRPERVDETADLFPQGGPRRPVDLFIVDLGVSGAVEAADRLVGEAHGDPLAVLFIGEEIPGPLTDRILGLPQGDFLRAPIDPTELLLRVRNLLRVRWLHARVGRHAEGETRLRGEAAALQRQRFELLERLARTVEYKDDETGEHPRRVGRVSALIALALGLPEELAELVEVAAPLHDIGKIAVPDEILLKPGELEVWEAELMRAHTVIGKQLLEGSESPILQIAEGIALAHHERWDGKGYPSGLLRGSIPIPARIVAVADAWDAMSFDRPYREALPRDRTIAEIRAGAGRQFDPRVVLAFLEETLPRIEREGLLRTA